MSLSKFSLKPKGRIRAPYHLEQSSAKLFISSCRHPHQACHTALPLVTKTKGYRASKGCVGVPTVGFKAFWKPKPYGSPISRKGAMEMKGYFPGFRVLGLGVYGS